MSSSGRITIIEPAKPPSTHNQRNHDTDSCNATAATTVSSSGVSITIAVYSPTCMYRRLKNAITLQVSSSAPRTNCSPGARVWNRRARRPGHSTAAVTTACTR